MVIDDLHLIGVAAPPNEADPPLVIDPDAVLAGASGFERFEPVAGRLSQIIEIGCLVDLDQTPQRHPLHLGAEASNESSFENRLGLLVAEAQDHRVILA